MPFATIAAIAIAECHALNYDAVAAAPAPANTTIVVSISWAGMFEHKFDSITHPALEEIIAHCCSNK